MIMLEEVNLMNILDYLILIIIILGALIGYKRGVISSVVGLVSTLVVIILAFYLKNPISVFLYEHFPFFTFTGKLKGITVYNIIIYEAISFLITLSILSFIIKILGKITGVAGRFDGSLNIGLFRRILGLLFGLVQGYLMVFFICFIVSAFCATSSLYLNSKYCEMVIEKTPLLNDIVNDTYNSIKEVYDITMEYQNMEDKTEANKESLKVLLKYEIVSEKSAQKLNESGKLKINNIEDVLNKYKEALK